MSASVAVPAVGVGCEDAAGRLCGRAGGRCPQTSVRPGAVGGVWLGFAFAVIAGVGDGGGRVSVADALGRSEARSCCKCVVVSASYLGVDLFWACRPVEGSQGKERSGYNSGCCLESSWMACWRWSRGGGEAEE